MPSIWKALRLPGTYAAKIDKIRPPLHVSLNNSVGSTGVLIFYPNVIFFALAHMYLVTLNLLWRDASIMEKSPIILTSSILFLRQNI